MLSGHTYALDRIGSVISRVKDASDGGGCRESAVGRAAVLQLYVAAAAERTLSRSEILPSLERARRDIRSYLVCSPQQPFHWYALFWIEAALGTPVPGHLRYLALSYELAPREAWIAYYRNADALTFYERAGPRLRMQIEEEYRDILRDQVDQAGAIFASSTDFVRKLLVRFAEAAPIEQRRKLAVALDRYDVLLDLPGVEYREGRTIVKPAAAGF